MLNKISMKTGGFMESCLPSYETLESVGSKLFILVFFIVIGFLLFTYFSGKNYSSTINCKKCIHNFTNNTDAITTYNSISNSNFLEPVAGYTISISLKITDFYNNSGSWRHIFHKGSDIINNNDINYNVFNTLGTNEQCPGVWLHPDNNNLRICLTTLDEINNFEYFDINNIILSEWVELSFNIYDNICEVYLNGTIIETYICKKTIKYSPGNCYFLYGGGTYANIKNFRYIPDKISSDAFLFMKRQDI
jgi:hypothetical protein